MEDDGDARAVLAEALEDEGYRVATAGHGEEALALLRCGLRPAIILLDLLMPIMGGRELLACMAQEADLARIPVIALSGLDRRATATSAQVRVVLLKPVLLDELFRGIAMVLRPG